MKALLERLVKMLPRAFREQFGAGMLDEIERDYGRARAQGRLAAVWCTVATAWDLIRSAIAERLRPSWPKQHLTREATRSSPGVAGEWLGDLRYALRALARANGFAAISIGTLGLAMGATAALFSVVYALLLHPLPYRNADRLVYIGGTAPGSDLPDEFGVSAEFFVLYKQQSKLLEDVSPYNAFTQSLRVGDRVERVTVSWPSNSLYSTLQAKPILGRLPVDADEDRAFVISNALWKSWFGSDPSVIGRSYQVAGATRTIVGVMGPEFRFPNEQTTLWISGPVRMFERAEPGHFGMSLVGRMKPGVTMDAVAKELTALSKRLPERVGGSANYARIIARHRAVVRPLIDELYGDVAGPLWVLLGAAVIVLLIACANVANLFMVRAEGRQRDLAVRRAIGAASGRLIRSQMAEAVVIAATAGLVAVGLAWAGLPLLLRLAPQGIPRVGEVHIGATTLVFTLGVAFVSAVLCGLGPAIRASSPDLTRLRDGGRGSTRGRSWARDGLVVAQTALALVLLIGSGLLVRSFRALRQVNPGYTTTNIFTFQIAPESPTLSDGPSFARFDLMFMDRLRAIPGVETVGLVDNIPLDEGTQPIRVRADGSAADASALMSMTVEAGDYFKAMGIRVLNGRPLETRDHLGNLRNVVISRTAANMLWPNENPIGRRLQREGLTTWETVVGVVDDVMQYSFRDSPQPLVYFPLVGPEPNSWAVSSPAFVVKTPRAAAIEPEIRALVREVAPSAPMYRVYTMERLAKRSMTQVSFTLLMLGVASALALMLGAVGLYGVLSYVVAQRTREIGVRMALGAEAGRVRRMVVAQGARVVFAGVVIGLAAAIAFTRALASLLFGVKPVDATTFVAMSVSMLAIGLVASYVPARRASKVDPIESLRGE